MLESAWVEEGHWVRTQGPAKHHALAELTKGGPVRWPQRLTLQGEVGQDAPFAVDTIPIPHDNPFGTLFFVSVHDFFKDGRATVPTMTGGAGERFGCGIEGGVLETLCDGTASTDWGEGGE